MNQQPNGLVVPASSMNSSSPIQRFVIVHWSLAKLSSGKVLGDGASESEVGEEILYHYCHHPSSATAQCAGEQYPVAEPDDQQEVISFVGLCKALYTLPDAICHNVSSTASEDPAQHVVLANCLLTFCPLEQVTGIVAIVQTARATTPSAVRAAVQRSHQLFCMLRGGGIHRRLGAAVGDLLQASGCQYPGMDQLYILRQRERRLESQWTCSSRHDDIEKERIQVQEDIRILLQLLPLSHLKRDLQIHYEDFLGELAVRASVSDSVLRSIVEEIPAPVQQPNGSHILNSTESTLESNQMDPVIEVIRDFLACHENQTKGVSIFYHGCFVTTMQTTGDFERKLASSETASLLLRYMSSFRYQMACAHHGQASRRNSTPRTQRRSLPPWMFSFGDRPLEPLLSQDHATKDCGFLGPPPLAFLSTVDEVNGVVGPYEGSRVWALPVSIADSESVGPTESCYVNARVSLFYCRNYSFLLYLNAPELNLEETCYVETFRGFLHQIGPVLDSDRSQFDDSVSSLETVLVPSSKLPGSGCDVMFVDWRSLSSYLYVAHRNPVDQRKFHLGLKKKFSSSRGTVHSSPPILKPDARDVLPYSLDCRHNLASHLSPNAILAVEDAIEEVRAQSNTGLAFEACTSLSDRWVYVYALDPEELYILFDSKQFITIADVQRCAREIRNQLSNRGCDRGKL
jgi:hypothetical protein